MHAFSEGLPVKRFCQTRLNSQTKVTAPSLARAVLAEKEHALRVPLQGICPDKRFKRARFSSSWAQTRCRAGRAWGFTFSTKLTTVLYSNRQHTQTITENIVCTYSLHKCLQSPNNSDSCNVKNVLPLSAAKVEKTNNQTNKQKQTDALLTEDTLSTHAGNVKVKLQKQL